MLGHYAKCHYGECHYAECHYGECHYAKCHYAECHYVDCRGVFWTMSDSINLQNHVLFLILLSYLIVLSHCLTSGVWMT